MKKLPFIPLALALVAPLALCATNLTDRANAQGTATTSETFSPVPVLTKNWYRYLVEPNLITCQWQKELQIILCQRHHKRWQRIESIEFEFLDANVEEYKVDTENSSYKAYRLFLNTDIGRIDVYDYGRDRDRAYADAAQFQAQLVKSGNPFLFFYENDLLRNLIVFLGQVWILGYCLRVFIYVSIPDYTQWRILKRCPFIRTRIKR